MKSLALMGTTIVTLKAYGDFLIAYSAFLRARAVHQAADIQLIAGEHVRPLGLALGVPDAQVSYIGGSSLKDVPAAFDARRCGLWLACRSMAAGQVVCATSVNAISEFIHVGATGVIPRRNIESDVEQNRALLATDGATNKLVINAFDFFSS
jgi:hypothetical protein